jgi:hypothetical protein
MRLVAGKCFPISLAVERSQRMRENVKTFLMRANVPRSPPRRSQWRRCSSPFSHTTVSSLLKHTLVYKMPLSAQDQALKRMLKLTNSLLSRSDAAPFAEPVDWRGLELWNYPKIIKKMMDLGTIKRKLERGSYKSHEECAEDIRLVWSNCMLYNEEDSDFWHLAKVFSKKFEDRYKKIQAECTYECYCCLQCCVYCCVLILCMTGRV